MVAFTNWRLPGCHSCSRELQCQEKLVQSTSPNRNLEAGQEACYLDEADFVPNKRPAQRSIAVPLGPVSYYRSDSIGKVWESQEEGNEEPDAEVEENGGLVRLSRVCRTLAKSGKACHGDLFIGQSMNGVLQRIAPAINDDFFLVPLSEVDHTAYTVTLHFSDAPFSYFPEAGEMGCAFRSPLLAPKSHPLWRLVEKVRAAGSLKTLDVFWAPSVRVRDLRGFPDEFVHFESDAHGTGWLKDEGETAFYAGNLADCLASYNVRKSRHIAAAQLTIAILFRSFGLTQSIARKIAQMLFDE